MTYVKSPFNYIGGKYKLLPQIIPLFPTEINHFYDIFGGGANVSLNVECNLVIYNDIVPYIGEFFKAVKDMNVDVCLAEIDRIIEYYNLSKENKEGFEKLRNDYNNGVKGWAMFFVLTCYSFNYQYRFNSKHEYNSSFGKNRSCFSLTMRERFKDFMKRLSEINIEFKNEDFLEMDYECICENDFVYFDPPYLISCGNYNDGKRGFSGWTQGHDKDLMEICNTLNRNRVRFAMSNVIRHKGKENEVLLQWVNKNNYTVHYLNFNYNNCNYQDNNKEFETIEVLITNY